MRHRHAPVLLVLALVLSASPGPARAADPADAHAGLVPVEGEPGTFVVQGKRGPMVARAATIDAIAAPDKIVNAIGFRFEADGSSATQVDTVTIDVGQTVRWHLVNGIHTVTNGEDSLDPNAGGLFNASLALSTPDFDFVFGTAGTYPYFCVIHEGFNMKGIVVVKAAASVPGGPVALRTGFARPPAPNPSTNAVAFSIALVRGGAATVEVMDAAGRRVATVHRGALPAGEHAFRWDGRAGDGRVAAAGVYRLRLRTEGVDQTRAFTLLH